FLRRAQEARYRVDPRDGCEAVRDRTYGLYARHQNAGAAHRLGRGPRCLGEISGEGDRPAVTIVGRTAVHFVARMSSGTASATALGASCGRLCPAVWITRRSYGPVKKAAYPSQVSGG